MQSAPNRRAFVAKIAVKDRGSSGFQHPTDKHERRKNGYPVNSASKCEPRISAHSLALFEKDTFRAVI
jgi:hypothetical protein